MGAPPMQAEATFSWGTFDAWIADSPRRPDLADLPPGVYRLRVPSCRAVLEDRRATGPACWGRATRAERVAERHDSCPHSPILHPPAGPRLGLAQIIQRPEVGVKTAVLPRRAREGTTEN